MELSYLAKLDTDWWIKHLCSYPVPTLMPAAQVTLNCDSSLLGWGCVIDRFDTIRKEERKEGGAQVRPSPILTVWSLKLLSWASNHSVVT